MVTAPPPHRVLVIGGIFSSEATAATTPLHSYSKQTPSLQTMEPRVPAVYNPDRIPASVFSNKPSNQTEWSVASTESMFSIHMGPCYSTKDITLPDIKAEETAISHESSNSFFSLPELHRDHDHDHDHHDHDQNVGMSSSSSSSSSRSTSTEELEQEEAEDPELEETAKPELVNEIVTEEVLCSRASDDKETRPSDAARSSAASTTQFSESSWNSKTSFAFPILAGKQARNESQNVTTRSPPVMMTTRENPQRAEPPQTDTIPDHRARWFCCFYCFRCPLFCPM